MPRGVRRRRDPVAVRDRAVRAADRWPSGSRCRGPTNPEENTRDERRLVCGSLLAVLRALAARRLRREDRTCSPTPAGTRQPLIADARLVPERRPRRHLPGARPTATSRDAGLDVHVADRRPTRPRRSTLLAAGKVDVAISYEPEVLLARNRGLPLVSVAAIVQQPLTSIVSIGSKHITYARAPARQDGRRRRASPTSTPTCRRSWRTRARAGRHGQGGQRRRQPRPGDAVRPASTPRSARTGTTRRSSSRSCGKHPNVIRMDQVGVPDLRRARAGRSREPRSPSRPSQIRRFVQALARGYESVRA